ncbi:hypothetical protein THASP1DRAFT_31765 [Thamnocephalis sphaerospora]|uniref:RRM domain-containing protein n=1 Tax=Thamnocephalis sphaerospora TaxID=78915 RepID=A0A4P9XKS1_9FUNG|nr:hypothetical protein THASP1DRAFT_31765 [Thamnocephalis sphaerospora]|eukprot:RKP06414.1 hypothetical protein THASP1DRAFT_31765 [Thamnocephalis sphaerospora]
MPTEKIETAAAVADNEKRQTKRQKKADAFRRGGSKKKPASEEKPKVAVDVDEAVAPDLKVLAADSGHLLVADGVTDGKSAKTRASDGKASKRRKRKTAPESSEPAEEKRVEEKKSKKPRVASQATGSQQGEHGDKKRRYIVFVGRMPRDAKRADIEKHFVSAGTPVDVRMLTDKVTGESRGCGFLEFGDADSLGRALNLHASRFKGKKITVELTVGGGGKSNQRQQRIREKNEKLQEERRRQEKRKKQAAAREDAEA